MSAKRKGDNPNGNFGSSAGEAGGVYEEIFHEKVEGLCKIVEGLCKKVEALCRIVEGLCRPFCLQSADRKRFRDLTLGSSAVRDGGPGNTGRSKLPYRPRSIASPIPFYQGDLNQCANRRKRPAPLSAMTRRTGASLTTNTNGLSRSAEWVIDVDIACGMDRLRKLLWLRTTAT